MCAAALDALFEQGSDLNLGVLRSAYARGALTPSALIAHLHDRLDASREDGIWISRVSREEALTRARTLEQNRALHDLPLYGVPFAVKDNIDVAGLPTTASLPSIVRRPAVSAKVVERLIDAGAIIIGKTNLDQLACGLTGTRSPYGTPKNPFNPNYITGGSSSGSAASVSRGFVSFALGTDTAGSGRVPAAFNDLVGLKPSPGLLSTSGILPACRSLDCVSVFANNVADAVLVAEIARGYDPDDVMSRSEADRLSFFGARGPERVRLGIPRSDQLEFFGDGQAERAFARAVEHWLSLGAERVTIDFEPFAETARLLYEGPWVAERVSMLDQIANRDEILPVLQSIFGEAERYDATATFRALHRLTELRRRAELCLRDVDALLLPTTPTIYTIAQIREEPRLFNARLGTYTNFVNLLGLAAIAVPNGFREDGLPTGVTLMGPRDSDAELAALAARFHAVVAPKRAAAPGASPRPAHSRGHVLTRLAVAGAHLSGQPLNGQLTELGARLLKSCRTAPEYRLFALSGVRKPGLVRTGPDNGAAIEIEVWELTEAALGIFMKNVAPPLCIGTLALEDGASVLGFLCEPHALGSAEDITHFGGWRAYVSR